jgi:hypothetical protein
VNLRTFVDVSEAKGCGESLDAVSREIGVEIYWLKRWRDKALAAMDAGLGSQFGLCPLVARSGPSGCCIADLMKTIILVSCPRSQARWPPPPSA